MRFILKVLNKIRYFIFLIPIMTVGLLTVPFVIFFNWNGIEILLIANEKCCSLSKAKRIFQEREKYQYDNKRIGIDFKNNTGLNSSMSNFRCSDDHYATASSDTFQFYQTSPSHSFLSYNIYYNNEH